MRRLVTMLILAAAVLMAAPRPHASDDARAITSLTYLVAITITGPTVTTVKCKSGEWDCGGKKDGVAGPTTPQRLSADWIVDNRDRVERDAATGTGEYLAVLAGHYGCGPAGIGRFGSTVQAHYGALFSDAHDADTVSMRLHTLVSGDADLRGLCQGLR